MYNKIHNVELCLYWVQHCMMYLIMVELVTVDPIACRIRIYRLNM